MKRIKDKLNIQLALLISIIVALVLSGYVAYQYRTLNSELKLIAESNQKLATLLEESKQENEHLLEQNKNKQAIIDSFQGQISSIDQTVGVLTKLAETDEELLKKYSKIYFLNENYVPATLADIEEGYYYNGTTNFLIHAKVWPYLRNMIDVAQASGADLLVASAFRSFYTQESLKAGYTITYGSGANQFSADQGYSEHQLGTAVDFTTGKLGASFSRFKDDRAYQWLLDNAYKYGFILSYPQDNSYYKFEPWHWRYVGVTLATRLHDDSKYFYDLDQREIDTYLVKLFD